MNTQATPQTHRDSDSRGRLTLIAAFSALIAMLFTLVGAPTAHAATIDPNAVTTIEIHKFVQPDALGQPANGLPQDTTGLTPVPGSTFTATKVPGINLTTNAGQQAATVMTAAEAHAFVAGKPADATATTNVAGNATLTPLGVGLYYVQETKSPAGYVGSAPFLVALPLTNPVELDHWLTTVHVYPKDAQARITLDIIDQDAVKIGDAVEWTSRSSIPRKDTIDGYLVEQVIVPDLTLVGPSGDIVRDVEVSLDCADCPPLTRDVDYTLSYDPDTRTISTEFLAPGLRTLERVVADDPHASVTVVYETTVHAEGIHINEAVLYPSRAAIDERRGVNDTATTKWGPLSVIVHEHGNPANLIEGARFEAFLSEEDARARRNPIIIEGVQEWITDAQGRLVIHGLRFSDFVNGLDREPSDPLYRIFWGAPTYVPPEWRWVSDAPLAGIVNDVIEYQTLIFEVVKEDEPVPPTPPAPPGPDLPITGGQIAGIGLLGAILIGAGALAMVARKRSRQDERDESGA